MNLMSFSLNRIYSSGFRDFSNKKMAGSDTFWLALVIHLVLFFKFGNILHISLDGII